MFSDPVFKTWTTLTVFLVELVFASQGYTCHQSSITCAWINCFAVAGPDGEQVNGVSDGSAHRWIRLKRLLGVKGQTEAAKEKDMSWKSITNSSFSFTALSLSSLPPPPSFFCFLTSVPFECLLITSYISSFVSFSLSAFTKIKTYGCMVFTANQTQKGAQLVYFATATTQHVHVLFTVPLRKSTG